MYHVSRQFLLPRSRHSLSKVLKHTTVFGIQSLATGDQTSAGVAKNQTLFLSHEEVCIGCPGLSDPAAEPWTYPTAALDPSHSHFELLTLSSQCGHFRHQPVQFILMELPVFPSLLDSPLPDFLWHMWISSQSWSVGYLCCIWHSACCKHKHSHSSPQQPWPLTVLWHVVDIKHMFQPVSWVIFVL